MWPFESFFFIFDYLNFLTVPLGNYRLFLLKIVFSFLRNRNPSLPHFPAGRGRDVPESPQAWSPQTRMWVQHDLGDTGVLFTGMSDLPGRVPQGENRQLREGRMSPRYTACWGAGPPQHPSCRDPRNEEITLPIVQQASC